MIEAGEKSGSLITARCALEQGRDVFAVPGDIVSSAYTGANRLIRDGAKPVLTAMDVLEEYQYLYPDTLHLTGADRPFAKLQKKQGQALHNMHNCARMHNIRETQAVSAQAAGSKSMPEHLSAPAKQLLTLLSAGALYVDEAADRLRLPAQDILRAFTELELYGLVRPESGRRYTLL